MTAFAGIDFSSFQVDIVLIFGDAVAPEHRFYTLPGHDAFERLRSIRHVLPPPGWWRQQEVIACAIEDPQGVQKGVVAKLKAVQGGILQCLPRELLVVPLEPSKWRKTVGLSGKASKEEVDLFVREQLGENPYWSQDASDSWVLAKAASLLVETEAPA